MARYRYTSDNIRIQKGNVEVKEKDLHKLPANQLEVYVSKSIIEEVNKTRKEDGKRSKKQIRGSEDQESQVS